MSPENDGFTLHTSADGVDFYLSDGYGIDDLKRCQGRSVEMMKVIVDVFEEHDIDYCLAHGTLLGLIRHGDFIPWDDDIDLFVFDNDYARAIQLLRRSLPSDMIVHNRRTDSIYWPFWTKIRDLGSDAYESLWAIDRRMKYHGICVDLLRVTLAKKVRKQPAQPDGRGKRGLFSLGKGRASEEEPSWRSDPDRYTVKPLALGEHPTDDDDLVCIANKDTVIECTFEYADVFPTKKMEFRGVEVAVPRNPEGVLVSMYGDYMKLPELENRKPHFDKVEFFDDVAGENGGRAHE